MVGKVVQWSAGDASLRGLGKRLESVLILLKAIEAGELLSALPDCEAARAAHQSATTLISIATDELEELCYEFSHGGQITRTVRPA